ncbi:replication-relaxation family protein [Paenibacillus thermotolerans]|uniref:replication-relaxation family protein n=1 Tax=Paenibacillus thermotolerans TaxID=3027807 RepID=UPI002367F2F6|nr:MULTISPECIES: replication-relaxation family protein [unclassified Paenibacillus]
MLQILTDRDAGILSTLAHIRFMTTSQIHLVHGYDGTYGIKVTRRKLCDLEAKGWIRSWQPSKYDQKIYYLTKAGAREIEYRLGCDDIQTYRKNEKTLHQIFVSEVYARLKTAAIGTLCNFRLNKKVYQCIPDAYAVYLLNGESLPIEIFLEVDRETESMAYIKETKMEHYLRLYSEHYSEHRPIILFLTITEHRKNGFDKLARSFNVPAVVHTLDEFICDPSIIFQGTRVQRIP